jgi:hypothetical protein
MYLNFNFVSFLLVDNAAKKYLTELVNLANGKKVCVMCAEHLPRT